MLEVVIIVIWNIKLFSSPLGIPDPRSGEPVLEWSVNSDSD